METIENYLNQIQEDEEQLQELDPITAGTIALAGGTLMVVWNLIRLLLGLRSFKKSLKVNKPMTKKLNGILSTNKWVVQVVPDPSPNAFAAGGLHVFITTGLMKILNEREAMAVLKLGYEYSLYYMLTFIISLLTPGPQLFFLAYFAFHISLSILRIPYAIIVGRKHEYGADANTVKYGYADDLVSGFKKMEIWIAKAMKKQKCGSVCKLVNAVSRAIDEHPDMQKRIENILRKKETAAAAESGNMGTIRKVVFAAAGIKQK